MHPKVEEKFDILIDYHCKPPESYTPRVLDVGSLDMNGSLRHVIERRGWTYTGLDIVPGPNVDVVAPSPYNYGTGYCSSFDLVISNATVEHVEAPWRWVEELSDCARPAGRVIIMCPWNMEPHASPRDYWRILPDGLVALMEHAGLMPIESGRDDVYSWAVGVKKGQG